MELNQATAARASILLPGTTSKLRCFLRSLKQVRPDAHCSSPRIIYRNVVQAAGERSREVPGDESHLGLPSRKMAAPASFRAPSCACSRRVSGLAGFVGGFRGGEATRVQRPSGESAALPAPVLAGLRRRWTPWPSLPTAGTVPGPRQARVCRLPSVEPSCGGGNCS